MLSFFGGISQDMFVPILPLYLANVLGLDRAFIGLSEGLVTAGASIFRLVAGVLSDNMKQRKSVIFVGYALSLISRPLLVFFSGGAAVLGLRFLDGVGKGVKDAPKDALIAGSSEAKTRGRSFGVARMLDTLGSVAGPLILFVLLYLWRNVDAKYHYILLLTAVPLVFTLILLVFKVREVPVVSKNSVVKDKAKLPARFYIFLLITAVFSLGNSSDAFLILRAQNIGVTLLAIPLVYALFNFIYAAASIPLGSLADKIGKEKVVVLGWAAYALAYVGFALANRSAHVWLLFAFYGLYYATTQGVVKALVADMVGDEHRGKAYGIFNTVVGLLTLPASVIAGALWDHVAPAAAFFFGAGMAGVAALLLGGFLLFRKNLVIPKVS